MSAGLSKSLGKPLNDDPIGDAQSFMQVLQAVIADPSGVNHVIERYIAARDSVAQAYAAVGPASEIPKMHSDVERLKMLAESTLADAQNDAAQIKAAAKKYAEFVEQEADIQMSKQLAATDAAASDRATAASDLSSARAAAAKILSDAVEKAEAESAALDEREKKLIAMDADLKLREAELASGRADLDMRIEAMKRLAL